MLWRKEIFYSHGIFFLPSFYRTQADRKMAGKETRGSNSSGNLQKQQRDRL
jgi:hypothetical protein